MRVAVVDIGTNSTRLLVADVRDGALTELERESIVTRLGEGVDATGRLGDAPQARVFAVLDGYRDAIERRGAERRTAVMTSAVRDAANGGEFAARVRDEYGLESRTLSGEDEARLTFLGATAARNAGDGELLVVDIGGGSTELVLGRGRETRFHASTQNGVVRHTERFLHHDPPLPEELDGLAADVRARLVADVPEDARDRPGAAVAVAGTATQSAAIDLALEPYDPERTEGHVLTAGRLMELRDRLAAVPLDERRKTPGLDPARAPTIVAGTVILLEVLAAFGLESVEVSERDILWGVALASTESP